MFAGFRGRSGKAGRFVSLPGRSSAAKGGRASRDQTFSALFDQIGEKIFEPGKGFYGGFGFLEVIVVSAFIFADQFFHFFIKVGNVTLIL